MFDDPQSAQTIDFFAFEELPWEKFFLVLMFLLLQLLQIIIIAPKILKKYLL